MQEVNPWISSCDFWALSLVPLCDCRYGDMRVMMTYELFSMWQNLGEETINSDQLLSEQTWPGH